MWLLLTCALFALAACTGSGPGPGLVHDAKNSASGFAAKRVSEQNECYDLQMEYPVLGHAVIDGQIKKLVDDEYAATQALLKDMCQRQKPEKPFRYWADYELYSSPSTVSLVFKSWLYADGSEQYLDEIKTLNCLWDGGAALDYAELFGSTNGFFEALLGHVHEALTPALKEAWEHSPEHAAALKPVKESFERFAITQEGLLFYFPTRQIAPFYAGPQQAEVAVRRLDKFAPRQGIWK